MKVPCLRFTLRRMTIAVAVMALLHRNAGCIVTTPILRGENDQPGSFTLFHDEVNDVLAAADALAALPYVDSTSIFVSGHSPGRTTSDPAKHRGLQAQRTEALCSRDPSRISSS